MTPNNWKIKPTNITDVVKEKVQETSEFLKELEKDFKKFKKNNTSKKGKKEWQCNFNIESKSGMFEVTNLFDTKQIVFDIHDDKIDTDKPIHSITLSYKEFKELSKFIKKIS
jgi:hypothetical protein